MNLRLFPLVLLCASCARPPETERGASQLPSPLPEIAGNEVPASWQLVNYVGGLVIPAPGTAKIARPQGIDSAILEVRGEGFSFNADDYGALHGPVKATLDGRRASVDRARSPDCERLLVGVELETPSNMHMCDSTGQNCQAAPGVANIGGHCTPGPGCETLERMIGSAYFVPRPYPTFRVDETDFKPEPPVCRMPDER